jgi:hypothetical protein
MTVCWRRRFVAVHRNQLLKCAAVCCWTGSLGVLDTDSMSVRDIKVRISIYLYIFLTQQNYRSCPVYICAYIIILYPVHIYNKYITKYIYYIIYIHTYFNFFRPRRVPSSAAGGLSRRWTWRHLAETWEHLKAGKAMPTHPYEFAEDVVCQSHTVRLTGPWFLLNQPMCWILMN